MRKKSLLFIIITFTMMASSFRLIDDEIKNGDLHFQQMKYREAIQSYLKAPENYEANWKLARIYIVMADTSSGLLKKAYITSAEKYARKSIELNAQSSYGHTWLAAALGNIALYEGSKGKVRLCNEIKSELDKAVSLNPNDDIAHSILGTFYRSLAGISWFERKLAETMLGKIPPGSYSDGEKSLKKAIEISPNIIRHWYELGLLYQAWNKKSAALACFTKAKTLPPQVISDNKRIKHIEELLK